MNHESYGKQIRKIRQSLNMTQAQVAKELYVTPGYISNVENDRSAMSLRMLIFYAKMAGMSLDSLVGQLEPEYAETSLDREVYHKILLMTEDEKKKLLQTLNIWLSD